MRTLILNLGLLSMALAAPVLATPQSSHSGEGWADAPPGDRSSTASSAANTRVLNLKPAFPAFRPRPVRGETLRPGESSPPAISGPERPRRPESIAVEPTQEALDRGQNVLRRMARFFDAQSSVSVKVRQHIDEEGTMGFVHGDWTHTITLARPNRFACRSVAAHAPEERSEVISNGEFVLRRSGTNVFVEEAEAGLTEILASEILRPTDPWKLDLPRVAALMDGRALTQLLQRSSVVHRGTRDFGGVRTDHLQIADEDASVDRPGKSWSLYVAQGDAPVPIMLVENLDRVFPSLANVERFSDSSLRLTDWVLNDVAIDASFDLEIEDNDCLVDSLARLGVGEPTSLNPMVGRPLPKFSVTDGAGRAVSSHDLLGKAPTLMVLWGDYSGMGAWWKYIAPIEARYRDAGVRVVAVYAGTRSREEVSALLAPWGAEPEIWIAGSDVSVMAPGARRYGLGRLTLEEVQVGSALQPYVIGSDGRIHAVIDVNMELTAAIEQQLNGLLAGRDMASENLASLAQASSNRQRRLADLRMAFSRRQMKRSQAAASSAASAPSDGE